ncbi:hypothetical protein IE53DRAFT_385496 [Violaceomyces palustris]|uniref:Uncharacterized protein n=1 Tax=Violaceomyces palustris TaxID=1673888 RepID=A0ACD0P1Z1_9BASI|nr:hypothetical protein IE53DRAFT_385496 [Violaceomyces palustris]
MLPSSQPLTQSQAEPDLPHSGPSSTEPVGRHHQPSSCLPGITSSAATPPRPSGSTPSALTISKSAFIYHPFQCSLCSRRFTRLENLKRHSALHSRSPRDPKLFSCPHCPATFSRIDLRKRHLNKKHHHASSPTQSQSQSRGQNQRQHRLHHSSPSLSSPQTDEPNHSNSAPNNDIDSLPLNSGRQPSPPSLPWPPPIPALSPFNFSFLDSETDWQPSPEQVAKGLELFFSHVARFFPIVHQHTFDPEKASGFLVIAMLCLGFQHADEPDLSSRCFVQAKMLVALNDPVTQRSDLEVVQAQILLQAYAMLYLCGAESNFAIKLHSKTIELARSCGLMQPCKVDARETTDLVSLWSDFVRQESHKRTLLCLHQMDALWYQILSLPRSISHLEIKHDMPCNEHLWMSKTASEWAHIMIVRPGAKTQLRYSECIRQFLAASPTVHMDPDEINPYGITNIIYFLLSSVREVSGWSTITGRISMERIEVLQTSLKSLEPFIRPRGRQGGPNCLEVEALWEMAMIQLLSWSPSHTGGVIEASMDAAIATTASLATCRVMYTSVSSSIQPHIDWFLVYLDRTRVVDSESPWILFYAFEAFSIAYQLLYDGCRGAMSAIDIDDGDAAAAFRWARTVFRRREKTKMGQIILTNLSSQWDTQQLV